MSDTPEWKRTLEEVRTGKPPEQEPKRKDPPVTKTATTQPAREAGQWFRSEAKFASTCPNCGTTIPVGAPVHLRKRTDQEVRNDPSSRPKKWNVLCHECGMKPLSETCYGKGL